MNPDLVTARDREALVWNNGIGFLHPGPHAQAIYGLDYWNKYVGYADTELGRHLTGFRIEFVRGLYGEGPLVDVGIGCGQFVEARPHTTGYDVSPVATKWLVERNLWTDLMLEETPAASFWDTLEHVLDPGVLLRNVRQWAFVTTPVFRDREHCLSSKHLRPGEHCWYFSQEGLAVFMRQYGFYLEAHSTTESVLGREDIETFAFKRRP